MYVLTYDGPVPARAWFHDLADGIKARTKARDKGYHVTLFKQGVDTPDAETGLLARRDNDNYKPSFADRLRTRFRRRNRNRNGGNRG